MAGILARLEPDEAARRIFDLYQAGDLAGIQGLVSAKVVVHMPGDNVLAGDYEGLGTVLALVARAATYFEPKAIRVLRVAAIDGGIETEVEIAGEAVVARNGGPLMLRQRMRFDDGGQISEAWIEPDDLRAWDDYLGSVSEPSE